MKNINIQGVRCNLSAGGWAPSCPLAFHWDSGVNQALNKKCFKNLYANLSYSTCNADSASQSQKSKLYRLQIQKPENKRDRQRVGELPKLSKGYKTNCVNSGRKEKSLIPVSAMQSGNGRKGMKQCSC